MANKTFKSLTPQGLDTTYKVPATAPEYAATNTYAVGDLAVYQGVLYKCTTAIDTPEAWTVQHWQDTTIGDEVSTLKESITQNEYEVTITDWQNGYFDTTQQRLVSNNGFATCGPMDYFDGSIEIPSTYTFKIFGLYNGVYTGLTKSNAWLSGDVVAQIPNTSKFFISIRNSSGGDVNISTISVKVKKRLSALESEYNYKTICTGFVNGKYITAASSKSLTPTNGQNYAYIAIPVSRGDMFIIDTTFSGNNVVGLCLVNADNVIVDYYDSTLSAPKLSQKLYQTKSDGTLYVCGLHAQPLSVWKLEKKENERIVDCYGDSLTSGAGDNNIGYPPKLQEILGSEYVVNQYGSGGNGVNTIACRMGALQMIIPPITIPASGPSESFEIKDFAGINVSPFNDGGTHRPYDWEKCPINPCVVSGIAGDIAINQNDEQYTFTRIDSGTEKVISSPSVALTPQIVNENEHICILWGGTNNTWQGIDFIDRYIAYMVEKAKSGRYIILGLTAKNVFSNIESMNTKMKETFGVHFLDIRQYILDYGLADAGITPTEEDTAAIENGEMPPSLLNDATHFNTAGYTVIAKQIYLKGQSLGYWA